MDWHGHELTDGFETVTRDEATPQQLFDLAHDMLDRLDQLEWTVACLVLLTLQHLEVISDPEDPQAYRETVSSLSRWLSAYQRGQEKIERDRQFMDLPE